MDEHYIIDTHSHINMLNDNIESIIKKASEYGVKKIIVPSAYPKDIDIVYDLCQKYDNIYGLLGVHPSEVKDWDDKLIDKIKKYSENSKIVGIGEIGLDYYWDKSFNNLQKEVFIKQIKLANELNLPVNIHDREAHQDTYEILEKHNTHSKVILHCYSGSSEFAKMCIKKGYYLGIGGVVTFKNAIKIKETVREIPLENILLETDAPYLTPVPHRGEENHPAYTKFVAEEIAKIKNLNVEDVIKQTYINTKKVFTL